MPHRRWTAEEKIRIVLESLNTSIGVAELCRKYTVNPTVFYGWKEKFIEGGKQALTRSRRNGVEGELQTENEGLKRLIGELTIANDAFKKVCRERKEDGSKHNPRSRSKPQEFR